MASETQTCDTFFTLKNTTDVTEAIQRLK